MQDLKFLDRLKNFDRNNVHQNTLNNLRKYTTDSKFDPQIVGQVNTAAKSLCMWCRAIDNYAKVAK